MPCGCKRKHKKKRGSGGTYLSGVTWGGYGKSGKTGKGMSFRGGALRKRGKAKRKRKQKAKRASGVNFSGSGVVFNGSGWKPLVQRR